MERRHLTTAITLLVLVGILVAGAMYGVKQLFAPIPSNGPVASPSPTCSTQTIRRGQRVRASQVQVSVFNGGTRAGLADKTMRALRARGFAKGDVGNSPANVRVRAARVLTTVRNDTAARLVARQFGRRTKVTVTKLDLGPGVDVIIGDDFKRLVKARRVIVARRASSVCVPVSTATSPTS